jgi:hypothetical protein
MGKEMYKQENYFIKCVHDKLRAYKVYWEKTHNPYRAGLPDVWYSGPRGDLWVEYKYMTTFPSKFRVGLTALQHKWLEERYKEGRNVAVIVGVPQRQGVILTELQWKEMYTKPDFLSKAQDLEEIVKWIASQISDGLF